MRDVIKAIVRVVAVRAMVVDYGVIWSGRWSRIIVLAIVKDTCVQECCQGYR